MDTALQGVLYRGTVGFVGKKAFECFSIVSVSGSKTVAVLSSNLCIISWP